MTLSDCHSPTQRATCLRTPPAPSFPGSGGAVIAPLSDTERAQSAAWQCLADACTEHDVCAERRAIEDLVRLDQMPAPRAPSP